MTIPVGILSRDNHQVAFFVQSGFVFVVSMSLLLYIFLPKILRKAQKFSLSEAVHRSSTATFELHTQPPPSEDSIYSGEGGEAVVGHPELAKQQKKECEKLLKYIVELETRVRHCKIVPRGEEFEDTTTGSQV